MSPVFVACQKTSGQGAIGCILMLMYSDSDAAIKAQAQDFLTKVLPLF